MNITEAKQIPIQKLAEALGGRYSHTDRKGDMWYYSPFRPDEKTASFKINEKKNTWHDFGLASTFAHQMQGSGGDIVDLWCDYHFKDRRLGIKDALAGLKDLGWFAIGGERLHLETGKEKPSVQNQQPTFKILKVADRISHLGLKEELSRRRVSLGLADLYLKQSEILNTLNGKTYIGFLFENDKGGYEVSIPNPKRNECFKTCIGEKASSRILTEKKTSSAYVYEGFWDFLSWLEFMNIKRPHHHSYILNSVSLVKETCNKIIDFKDEIKYAFLFMDNDKAGYHATDAISLLLENGQIQVGSFGQFYNGYKDLNEFWGANKLRF